MKRGQVLASRPSWGDIDVLRDANRAPYKHAPIVEAVVQIGVQSDYDATLLSNLFEGDAEPSFDLSGQMSVTDDKISGEMVGSLSGYIFRPTDAPIRVGAEINAFHVSSSRPYTRWDDLISEVESYWFPYKSRVKPTKVTALGVRFINRIFPPGPHVEFKDYLRTSVDISPYLPQSVNNLFMQVDLPLPSHQANAVITSALVPPDDGSEMSLILDIDAKKLTSLDVADEKFDETLRSELDMLRDAKNYVFEACITDATRRLIE